MDRVHKRLARSLCLKILFANNFSNNDFKELINNFFKQKDPDLDEIKYNSSQIKYASRLFEITIANQNKTDELIKQKLVNWEIDRIATIDRIILRMSLSEMLFMDEIPPKVSITEAVEIAKEFSSQDSSGFINGVMDAVYNDNFKKVSEHNKQDMGKDIGGCMDVAASNYNPKATVDDGSCKY